MQLLMDSPIMTIALSQAAATLNHLWCNPSLQYRFNWAGNLQPGL